MIVPPPVSGEHYPLVVGYLARSNYLRTGFSFNTSYDDNVLGSNAGKPVQEMSYNMSSDLALDQTTPRLHLVVDYLPGFTFYQKTSAHNQSTQNVSLNCDYRFTEHLTLSFRDSFLKSSNILNQADPLGENSISGGVSGAAPLVVAPLADQLSNLADPSASYQLSRNSMVGAAASFTNLHYPDLSQVPGLYDSSSRGASGFYTRRLTLNQYIGSTYLYSQVFSYPTHAQTEAQTHSVLMFYTIYFKPNLSLSVSGGPQYLTASQPQQQAIHLWTPALTASTGWQSNRISVAGSYLRLVNGGGGLVGAFHSDAGNASLHWQLGRTWNFGTAGSYSISNDVTPYFRLATPGGHSISGTVSLQHSIAEHLRLEMGYTRLHQSYSGIAYLAAAPDTDREYVSLTYQFSKPL